MISWIGDLRQPVVVAAILIPLPRCEAPDHRRKTNELARDSERDASPTFVVRDGNYLSARWPGDVHRFAHQFSAMFVRP